MELVGLMAVSALIGAGIYAAVRFVARRFTSPKASALVAAALTLGIALLIGASGGDAGFFACPCAAATIVLLLIDIAREPPVQPATSSSEGSSEPSPPREPKQFLHGTPRAPAPAATSTAATSAPTPPTTPKSESKPSLPPGAIACPNCGKICDASALLCPNSWCGQVFHRG